MLYQPFVWFWSGLEGTSPLWWLHLCSLLASSVRLLTRSSALCSREKRVQEVSLHTPLVPQAVGVLSRWAVVVLVCGRAERQGKVMELARCFAGAGRCWREPAGHWAESSVRLSTVLGVLGGTGTDPSPGYGQEPGSCLHCPWCAGERGGVVAGQPRPCMVPGHVAPFQRQAQGASEGTSDCSSPGLLPTDAIRIWVVEAMLPLNHRPQGLRVPLPLPVGVIYTVSCPGKFRSLTLPGWFPLSCPAPIGSSSRARALRYRQWQGRSLRLPAGRMEVPAGPGGGSVTPFRPDTSSSTSLGWLEKPTPCLSLRMGPAVGLDPLVPGGRKGGRARASLQSFWVPAESTPSPLPPSPPPHPSRLLPPGLRLPSLPFSLPSRSKQNGCCMAILFSVWKGETRTLGLGSFLEAAAMFEPNSPVSTWHRL